MRLIHYRKEEDPLVVESRLQIDGEPTSLIHLYKPRGFWVSDEDSDYSWLDWCSAEEFAVDRLGHAWLVTLAGDANVLHVSKPWEFEEFHERFRIPNPMYRYSSGFLFEKGQPDWRAVAQAYQGIIISPYLWDYRLSEYHWYYGWDCASGCIWDAAAIASVMLLEGGNGDLPAQAHERDATTADRGTPGSD